MKKNRARNKIHTIKKQSRNVPKKKPSKLYGEIRARRLKRYESQKGRLSNLSNEMLISEYVHLKSTLESQKLYFSVIIIGLIVSIISGIWGTTYKFLLEILTMETSEKITNLPLVIGIFLCLVALVILVLIVIGITGIKRQNKKILIIDEIRRKKKI